jgi:hypothetical protein
VAGRIKLGRNVTAQVGPLVSFEAQHRKRQINHLKWKAAKLGFQIVEAAAA